LHQSLAPPAVDTSSAFASPSFRIRVVQVWPCSLYCYTFVYL
jgi:3-polyprenyl-4-hydroxybenzoate decarboxylase